MAEPREEETSPQIEVIELNKIFTPFKPELMKNRGRVLGVSAYDRDIVLRTGILPDWKVNIDFSPSKHAKNDAVTLSIQN